MSVSSMTPPPPAEARSPKGSWFRQALARLDVYRKLERGDKGAFIASFSRDSGLAANTAARQLAALDYLAERRVDLEALASRPPALMAIEAVARIARAEPEREGELLRALASGKRTIQWFRREAEKIDKDAEPLTAAPTLRLSDIMYESVRYYRGDSGDFDEALDWALSLEFRSGGPESPLVVVEQFLAGHGGRGNETVRITTWLFKIAASDPRVVQPHFQEMLDRFVLRGVVSADHVVVCADMTLPVLNETVRLLNEARKTRAIHRLAPVTLVHCALDVDVEQPKGDDRWRVFNSAHDYFTKYGRHDERSREQVRRDADALRDVYSSKLTFGYSRHPRGLY